MNKQLPFPLSVIKKVALLHPKIREIYDTTETIVSDLNHWQENLVKHLDKNNDQIVDALGYLKKGSMARNWLDSKLPGFADAAEKTITDLAHKQSGKRSGASSTARPQRNDTANNANNRARYRILPLK